MAMQYTLRNIPPHLDRVLRQKAKEEHKSLNQVAIDALKRAFGLTDKPVKYRDLSDVAGAWVDDPAFDEALEDQRRIDPELWR
jgi:hypothetical protein